MRRQRIGMKLPSGTQEMPARGMVQKERSGIAEALPQEVDSFLPISQFLLSGDYTGRQWAANS